MGTTVARAARWSSVEGTQGKLEYTSINEYILNEITQFVIEFSAKNPKEARVVFKKPLVWFSENLSPANFTGLNLITRYFIRKMSIIIPFTYDVLIHSKSSNGSVSSTETSLNGDPLLSISYKNKQRAQITALTLEKCAQVLQTAREKRISETRSCLESILLFYWVVATTLLAKRFAKYE